MNYSIFSADRPTHLKIVVVALLLSTGIAGLAIAARFKVGDQPSQFAHVIKAGKPGMKFAVAVPARQDASSGLIFVNGSPALSGSEIK